MKGTNVATMVGDGAARPTKLQKRRPVRRVFGRVKNVEVGSALFTFELTKVALVVHRRRARRARDMALGFDRLVNGGGFDRNGVKFALTAEGLELRRGKARKLLSYETLANFAADQPLLFPEAGA